MFNITGKQKEFGEIFEGHRLNISTKNVYFQNIRLLNTYKPDILSREDFEKYYKVILNDIKNESTPIECIIPNDEKLINEDSDDPNAEVQVPEGYKLFVTNQIVPEYKQISARIKADDINTTFPPTHPVRMAVINDPSKLDQVIDDAFVHWLLFKYLEAIDTLQIHGYSNYTPVIEWTVNNITESDLKSFIKSDKINKNKIKKFIRSIAFAPDFSRVIKFYSEERDNCPKIDVENLIYRLISNEDVKPDLYIIGAIYQTLSFAMSDIYTNNIEESPCAKYVIDVLSKI